MQRQNEPSGACSSRNPQNCLFGGNDYRSVDIPFPPDADRVIGDAWLGWYTTKDGGQTWKTRLLPGYPQDTSPEGLASPLKGMEAGADPVVRSGANGMFFYAGIAFVRGPGGASRLFVARFIDNNDRERPDVESITYLDTHVIQAAPQGTVGNFFVDKPWLAVDIPRPGARRCRIGGRSTGVARQNLPCARVYVAYTVFSGEAPNQRATIMIARSEDSGATWSPAEPLQIDADVNDDGAITNADLNLVKQGNRQVCQTPGYNEALDLNLDCSVNSRDANLVTRLIGSTPPGTVKRVHQGAALAIAPSTGAVHLAYRQFKSGTSPDAIFATRSTDGGVTFSTPAQVALVNPFDQGTSATSFRTNAFPTLAVDEVGRCLPRMDDARAGRDSVGPRHRRCPRRPGDLGRRARRGRRLARWTTIRSPVTSSCRRSSTPPAGCSSSTTTSVRIARVCSDPTSTSCRSSMARRRGCGIRRRSAPRRRRPAFSRRSRRSG